MNGRSLIIIIAALTGGILLSHRFNLPVLTAAIPLSAGILFFITSIVLKKKNPFVVTPELNEIYAAFLFLGTGIFSESIHRSPNITIHEGVYHISGRIEDYTPTNYGDKVLMDLFSLNQGKSPGIKLRNAKALITVHEASRLTYGDVITAETTLYPIDKPGNFLKEDYENYLRSKSIVATGEVKEGQRFIVSKSTSFTAFGRKIRDRFEEDIENTTLQGPTKNFLISVLLGDKTYMNSSDRLSFNDAGIAHIFAVSGFHVSLISFFILSFLSIFFIDENQKWKFIVALPPIWAYIYIIGASPATLRAAIMITIALTALFLQRRRSALKSLGWAIVLILMFNAGALFDVGFQLSVVCVGSIMLIAQPLNFVNHRNHPWLFKLVSISLITIVASFSSWIICAFYFHRFSFMFLPLNLVAVPLLPVYLIVALIYIIFANIGITLPLTNILDTGYRWLREGSEWVSSTTLPLADLYPPGISVGFWIAGLAGLGFLLYLTGDKIKNLRKLRIPAVLTILLFGTSIMTFAAFSREKPQGFILQKNSRETSIMHYDNNGEQLITLQNGTNSLINLHDKKIVVLGNSEISARMFDLMKDADIIILSKGIKSLPEGINSLKEKDFMVVTHPSLHWRHERKIIEGALESGIKLYSLRKDGPLHIFN